jgi:hypothetical protein
LPKTLGVVLAVAVPVILYGFAFALCYWADTLLLLSPNAFTRKGNFRTCGVQGFGCGFGVHLFPSF